MGKGIDFICNLERIIQEIKIKEGNSLRKAAEAIVECLGSGGMIYAFGTGHSHMLAEELFYRAGGLVRVNPILDEGLMLHAGAAKSTSIERLHGYAEALLEHYPINKKDVIFIFSNSGRNAVTVDMAMLARDRGAKVIAVTNLRHSQSAPSRHNSNKRLYEAADIVLDNYGEIGDASIPFEGLGYVGPTSTIIGAMLLHSVICEAIEIMLDNGNKPEVFVSSNVDAGDAINQEYIRKYSGTVKCL